jgi:hypothetical protein
MVGMSDVSVSHIASSLAENIAGREPAAPSVTGAGQANSSVATCMRNAFDGLRQGQNNSESFSKDSLVAPIAPFSTPSISRDSLMNSLREAVGAFHELSGGQQRGLQQLAQLSDKQQVPTLGGQQLAQLSDKQHVPTLGDQQLAQLSNMQRSGSLGVQQLMQSPRNPEVGSAGEGVKMLDHCKQLFSLLQKVIDEGQDLASKSRQTIR